MNSNYYVELNSSSLAHNLNDWEFDVALMLYAPWCQFCKQLDPYLQQIASQTSSTKNLVIGRYNCEEESNTWLCSELEIKHYPSIVFVGYGNFHQIPSRKSIFTEPTHPRIVRFTADLYPDAIYDWIRMLQTISWLHRVSADIFGFIFSGGQSIRLNKKVAVLKEEIDVLESRVLKYQSKLDQYESQELFDSLELLTDPFPLLHSTVPNQVVFF